MPIGESFANVLGSLTGLGRLNLEQQMQPYRIRSVQATIDDLNETTRTSKYINDILEKSTKDHQATLDDLDAALNEATTPAGRQAAVGSAVASYVPGLGVAQGSIDNAGLPASVQGLPATTPDLGQSLQDYLGKQQSSQAITGLLQARLAPPGETAATPGIAEQLQSGAIKGPAVLTRAALGIGAGAKWAGNKVWNGLQWVDEAEMFSEDALVKLLFGSGQQNEREMLRLQQRLGPQDPGADMIYDALLGGQPVNAGLLGGAAAKSLYNGLIWDPKTRTMRKP